MAKASQKDTRVGDTGNRRKRAGRWIRTVSCIVVLGASVAFLAVGSNRSHKVVGEDAEEVTELLGYIPSELISLISDRQLVIDATFTGVVRKGEMLVSTYDRSQPPKKQACPT